MRLIATSRCHGIIIQCDKWARGLVDVLRNTDALCQEVRLRVTVGAILGR